MSEYIRRDGGRPCRIILTGMMGSGKTTIGRLLASRTGWPYHDNDELLRRRVGLSAREVAERHGERGLRDAEMAALIDGLAQPEPCIVGTAAGTIMARDARERMKRAGLVAWLRARPDTLAVRAAGGWHRPWLDRDPVEWLAGRARERGPLFGEAADMVVDVDARTPGEIADAIQEAAGEELRCPA